MGLARITGFLRAAVQIVHERQGPVHANEFSRGFRANRRRCGVSPGIVSLPDIVNYGKAHGQRLPGGRLWRRERAWLTGSPPDEVFQQHSEVNQVAAASGSRCSM